MLAIVRSPVAAIPRAGDSLLGELPAELSAVLNRFLHEPRGCIWIVPTSRRRRAMQRTWLCESSSSADLLPSFQTLESFVGQVSQYSLNQPIRISGTERILRVASAWQRVRGQGAGPGFVRQLDRFARDWQACLLEADQDSPELYERFVHRYLRELETDGSADRMSSLRALTVDLCDPQSWPYRIYLGRFDGIIFDGFHRFERAELDLIASLARHKDVLLWLVGCAGQASFRTTDSITAFLRERLPSVKVFDLAPACAAPLAATGRELFPAAPGRRVSTQSRQTIAGLRGLTCPSPLAEVEAVARHIKHLYRQGQGENLRLSDFAVVIPGPAYDPLIREAFPRAGLEFNLAGRALEVYAARPARLLLAALEVIRGQWRWDLLLDLLNQPLVKRGLTNAHRLHDLFEFRPRARRRLRGDLWRETWRAQLAKLGERIQCWRSGDLDLPERAVVSRDEFVERQEERAASLMELLGSVEPVIERVEILDQVLTRTSRLPEIRPLIGAVIEFLRVFGVHGWLCPPAPPAETDPKSVEPAVPWVEYEKDQQAYFKLLAVLQTLSELDAERVPIDSSGNPDLLAVLQLALESETYQIKTEDDAGVQVFEIREIRGLRFQHVYALGLNDGVVPILPEEGALSGCRRRISELAEQLEQKEQEAGYQFAQLFESAIGSLVLSRPCVEAERDMLPSSFLSAVEERVELAPLSQPTLLASSADMARALGRFFAAAERPTAEDVFIEALDPLGWRPAFLTALDGWKARRGQADATTLDARPLLERLFPPSRSITPSELELYAACPFRYFGRRILKLDEREPDRTRLEYGSLVHRVLQSFYNQRRLDHECADNPLPPVTRAERGRLLEIFHEQWHLLDPGVLPPDLDYLFGCDGGVLDHLLEILSIIEVEEGSFGNLLTEFKLENVPIGRDSHDRVVLLTGTIDRVDADRDHPKRTVIFDYKTGKANTNVERQRKTTDGRFLQLPLYAAALPLVRPGLEVVAAAYLHLSERPQSSPAKARTAIGSSGNLLKGGKDSFPLEAEAALLLALELISKIRAGLIPLTQHGESSRYPECTSYCTFRHACRHPAGYKSV